MANEKHEKQDRTLILLGIALLSISTIFVILEEITHWLFFGHLAAIPLEILVGAFLVERFLSKREKQEKLSQLMYIKSYLFRSEMRNLFIMNFRALTYPILDMKRMKSASIEELTQLKNQLKNAKYRSLEEIEPILDEYVKAHSVFYGFMEWAINNDFEPIVQNMIYILHFIQDIKLFKETHPDQMFVKEAYKNKVIGAKVKKVIIEGIMSFLDYIIEIKQKQPEIFEEVLEDYRISTEFDK